MKKILFAIISIIPITAISDTMCVRDNTLVISLDASIKGEKVLLKDGIWAADFPYGRIYGEYACLSISETMGQTTPGTIYGTGEYKNTLISAVRGMTGTDPDGNVRGVCVCRMTHPAISSWAVLSNFNSSASCNNNCNCGIYNSVLGGMFSTVGLIKSPINW